MLDINVILKSIKNGTIKEKINKKFFITSPNARTIEKQYRVYNKLHNEYKNIIDNHNPKEEQKSSNYVWICWFQGIENAPDLIKACVNSVKQNMPNKDIVILTQDNLKDYIQFPQYIIEKYEKGIITKAHYSDIIRAELLYKYGGIWIDSTVLCTSSNIPNYILNAPLFVYKSFDLFRTNESPIVASSWFLVAKSNNPILMLTRELLYSYWEKNDYLIDYYLFHLFFTMAAKKYEKEWNAIPTFNNHTPHTLMFELGDKYSKERFEQIKEMSAFHKLERHTDYSNCKDSMYEYIIKTYGE